MFSKRLLKIALFFVAWAVVLYAADVKLRIYLKDGTLQSGNYVNETPTSYVILGKEGRVEVLKEQIMFINGKTLRQWQERPDKSFQTEIIPSDVPDPAYVHGKAPLPAVPSLPAIKTVLPASPESAQGGHGATQQQAAQVAPAQGTVPVTSPVGAVPTPTKMGQPPAQAPATKTVGATTSKAGKEASSEFASKAGAKTLSSTANPQAATTNSAAGASAASAISGTPSVAGTPTSAETAQALREASANKSAGTATSSPAGKEVPARYASSKAGAQTLSQTSSAQVATSNSAGSVSAAPAISGISAVAGVLASAKTAQALREASANKSVGTATSSPAGKEVPARNASSKAGAKSLSSTSNPQTASVNPAGSAAAASGVPVPVVLRATEKNAKTVAVVHKRSARLKKRKIPLAVVAFENPVEAKNVPAPTLAVAIPPDFPKKFDRNWYAGYHRSQAEKFAHEGRPGQAIQELHIATTLDRFHADSFLALGKLYRQEGAFDKAEKYLRAPILKKNEEAKALADRMETELKNTERDQWILSGSATGGVLLCIPLLMLERRWRRKKLIPTVISADHLEPEDVRAAGSIMEEGQEEAEEVITQLEKLTGTLAQPVPSTVVEDAPMTPGNSVVPPPEIKWSEFPASLTVEQSPLTQEKPFPITPPSSEVVRPPQKPLEKEATPPPLEIPSVPPTVPPLPAVASSPSEIKEVRPQEVRPAEKKESESPRAPEPILPTPVPQPLARQAWTPPPLSSEELLERSRLVDELLQAANGFALQGDLEHARREYRTALALNRDCVAALLGLGYLAFLQGQWDLAVVHYTRALEMDPQSADAHYGLGRVLLETERIDDAVPELQATLIIDPTFLDAEETLTALGKAIKPAPMPQQPQNQNTI